VIDTSIEFETLPYSSACLYAKHIVMNVHDIMPMRQFVQVLISNGPIRGYSSVPAWLGCSGMIMVACDHQQSHIIETVIGRLPSDLWCGAATDQPLVCWINV
jgi:hypothetical protein